MVVTSDNKERARKIALEAYEYTPEESSWGMCSYDDGPVAFGGGAPAFHWFSGREGLLEFIWRWEPHNSNCPDDPDVLSNDLKEICGKLRPDGCNLDEIRLAINERAKGTFGITWWGSFLDLATGDSEFARETRVVLNDEIGEADHGPLAPDRYEELIDYCREYC